MILKKCYEKRSGFFWKKKYNRNTTKKVASVCDLSAALISALRNKKGDAAISAAAEKNKKEDAGLANIGNGLIAPRSQLGFGTVPRSRWTTAFAMPTLWCQLGM